MSCYFHVWKNRFKNNLQSLKIQKYLRKIKRFYLLKKKHFYFERPLGNSGNLKVPLIDRDVQPEVLTPVAGAFINVLGFFTRYWRGYWNYIYRIRVSMQASAALFIFTYLPRSSWSRLRHQYHDSFKSKYLILI